MTPTQLFTLTTYAIETLLSNLTLPCEILSIGPIPIDPAIEGATWQASVQIEAGMEWFVTALNGFTDPTFLQDENEHFYKCRPLGFGGKIYNAEGDYVGFGLSIEISY